MDGVIVLIELVVASIWIMQGFTYGFWKKGRPGGGFLGVIFGALILVIALVMGIRMLIKRDFGKKIKLHVTAFLPIFMGGGAVILSYLVGFIIALFAFLVGWLRFISKYSWAKTLLISVLFTLGLYAIFVMWLRVPFPTGVF